MKRKTLTKGDPLSPDPYPLPPVGDCRRIRRRLLTWYDRHKRDLPWRRRQHDGYAQLLAEFMLQQTQVSVVVDYYNRFMQRFPNVAALANAERDDVLALWSGLGYYSRARNLHAAAQEIVQRFDGHVPDDVDDLMTLPGVGRYTAGAIASIAYDRRAPVLDGNVTRVLMRLLALDADPASPAVRDHLWSVAEALLPKTRCGDFNQALMELGATICAPCSPQCLLCPLSAVCHARRQGATDRIPPPKKRARVQEAVMVAAAVRNGSKLLFTQRPAKGLWASLWELPSEPVAEGEPLQAARQRLQQRLPEGCKLEAQPLEPVVRQLTHRRVTFHTYPGRAEGRGTRDEGMPAPSPLAARRSPLPSSPQSLPPNPQPLTPTPCDTPPFRWLATHELAGIGLSRAAQALLELIDKQPDLSVQI